MDSLLDGSGAVKMQYAVNGQGQRVAKYLAGNPAATQYAIRDESGQVLGEYDGNRTRVREVVWLDGMPVGVLSGASGGLAYLEPDQIGTPRVAIDAVSGAVSWSWDPVDDPFGQTQPTGSLGLDLRMPGQVYDSESGGDYNYFRDYDPSTGRYVESDPLGLGGGISTYAYVAGNPLRFSDPFGLEVGSAITPASQMYAMGMSDGQRMSQDLSDLARTMAGNAPPTDAGVRSWICRALQAAKPGSAISPADYLTGLRTRNRGRYGNDSEVAAAEHYFEAQDGTLSGGWLNVYGDPWIKWGRTFLPFPIGTIFGGNGSPPLDAGFVGGWAARGMQDRENGRPAGYSAGASGCGCH